MRKRRANETLAHSFSVFSPNSRDSFCPSEHMCNKRFGIKWQCRVFAEAVYFVPIGDAPMKEINALIGHYREKFGIEIGVLRALSLNSSDVDTSRQQLVSENVLDSMRRAHPEYSENHSVILIGITGQDMYPRSQ